MGWLASNLPQANLYMSVQGSTERSIEERSSDGKGFSGPLAVGVAACWASAAAPEQASVTVRAKLRRRTGRIQGSPCYGRACMALIPLRPKAARSEISCITRGDI